MQSRFINVIYNFMSFVNGIKFIHLFDIATVTDLFAYG
jgi:hypothetical protein